MEINLEETPPPIYIEQNNGELIKLDFSLEEIEDLKSRGAEFRKSTTTRDGGLILE